MAPTRTLQTNDRPTRLARALQELGRLIKTLYLLRFIDDEGIGAAHPHPPHQLGAD
ncbi:MAG: hypothetical protein EOS07_32445 [Mesorhizobium sp.]|uniref:Tn3 family transposase n=1 Tax=Mesorhizobium sp. TaxID=1871066 RepID=UPI000FEA5075|nr:MAG: hypothetical protein EOR47_33245 [Mesorhizobium sp.]RWO03802.1 MAG: hypothetical protein EOS07_32445 [Mesorhizobium sp.]RWO28663.1 MAG: hypothetical protein EOS08_13615 [Mesorhizobium sp.]TIP39350.1 MAG: hypothetical protein E5X62_31565 [Mesorhizobium sp.]TIQ06355.1 MAG: hypothetical protein E5X57_26160 [Mesorhizobium sp.]